MLELIGPEDGDERRAAEHLRDRLLQLWPTVEGNKADKVRIHAAAKLYGYRVQDLDVVLLAHFSERRPFEPTTEFHPKDGPAVRPRKASVSSLVAVIEVKMHDARAVRFEGITAYVRYRRGGEDSWEDASDQSHKQLHAFRGYLKDHGCERVFVTNLILFPNLRESDLPRRPHNIIGGDASFNKILNVLGEISGPWIRGEWASISAGKSENVEDLFRASLFRSITPTAIDRKRMDRIARRRAIDPDWLADLSQRQVVLRGRGGAGKTVVLLQLAYNAFDINGARSLLLTYNRALMADICRTMALLQIPNDVDRGGVRVDSVMAFVGRILRYFELIAPDDNFLQSYSSNCAALAEMLHAGAISANDVAAMKRHDATEFSFDHVFIDEGQDWPESEIAILRAIYQPERLIIADGMDQFVRGSVADWHSGIEGERLRTRRLRRCLRMKSNLAAFANTLAREIGREDWEVEPNPEAAGGRIVIVEGEYFRDWSIHERIILDARAAGNEPVDLLVCVPPTLAQQRDHAASSLIGERFVEHGYQVWDGVVPCVRHDVARDTDQLRIVQYESCRGLEGWTVFALGFDEFWDLKFREGLRETAGPNDLFVTAQQAAQKYAARWAMIPLTRAMDTLVIQVSHSNTPISEALRKVAESHGDFVDWVTI